MTLLRRASVRSRCSRDLTPSCSPRWSAATRCPAGSSAPRTTTSTGASRATTSRRSTTRRSRRRSRTRRRPGVDVVSDGELRRDNMIDHFTTRLPGVQIDHASKKFYYDFYDCVVRGRLPTGSLGLVEEFRFLRRFTERRAKVSVTGPLSLVKRIRNEYYPSEEALALDIARVMNVELRELVAGGGDRPPDRRALLLGLPRGPPVGGARAQCPRRGRGRAPVAPRLLWQPVWQALVGGELPLPVPGDPRRAHPPADARVRPPRRGRRPALQGVRPQFTLGLGVVDVKSHDIETPAVVAERIRAALELVPAKSLAINPDCGLMHLPRDVAFAKLSRWWRAPGSCGPSWWLNRGSD